MINAASFFSLRFLVLLSVFALLWLFSDRLFSKKYSPPMDGPLSSSLPAHTAGPRPASSAAARAALLGAIVADAASVPLHWEYDTASIARDAAGGRDIAFFRPPRTGFYTSLDGGPSPYGSEQLPLLSSLVLCGGLRPKHLAFSLGQFFLSAPHKRPQLYLGSVAKAMAASYVRHGGTADPPTDPAGGCSDGGEAPFGDMSPPDDQNHSVAKAPALVARYYAETPSALAALVVAAVGAHQAGVAVAAMGALAALLLQHVVIAGGTPADAVRWAVTSPDVIALETSTHVPLLAALEAGLKYAGARSVDAAAALGAGCHLPGALSVVVAIAATETSYAAAVRANILAGGDSAGRAWLLGALFAAADVDAIPPKWLAKTASLAPDTGELRTWVDALAPPSP